MAVPAEIPSIRCTEELSYVTLLKMVMAWNANLCDMELVTDSLSYVALLHPFDRHYLLISFYYCLREAFFERLFRLKSTGSPFGNWHSVIFSDISPHRQNQMYEKVLKR